MNVGSALGALQNVDIYFFLRVKNDFRFDSSLADDAGNVIERLSPLAALWHCVFRAPTHWFISASSCACSRNSAPVDSLQSGENTELVYVIPRKLLCNYTHFIRSTCFFFV